MYLEKPEVLSNTGLIHKEILNDYFIAFLSRQLSILGRREVHNGRAHFGIFGDGKEVAQIAYAKTFRKGDWRSGYYRDQTFMLALGILQPEEFFAMIYGDTDHEYNPSTGGRNFNNHFSTSNINGKGEIKDLLLKFNSASDLSPTAGQMPRLLGLAQASKIVRENPKLKPFLNNNVKGNEVAFGSIGDASTSEGMFFETINAAGVMQVPMAVAIYDDGYGISVPVELQTTKGSISEALKGFEKGKNTNGIRIYTCAGWDYPKLVETFSEGIDFCRKNHVPVLFHINELTQPLGHSTSGSHEKYKGTERLAWEKEFDGIVKFKTWILENGIADYESLSAIENRATRRAKEAKDNAWNHFTSGFEEETSGLEDIVKTIRIKTNGMAGKSEDFENIRAKIFPTRRSLMTFAKRLVYEADKNEIPEIEKKRLILWIDDFQKKSSDLYNHHLFREGSDSALRVKPVAAVFSDIEITGSEVINKNFHALFTKYPNLVTFGEDTGRLGDVNQGTKGLLEVFGQTRVSDTGIRETTIIGQGIGLALRGFRAVAEIQYLDYLLYALPTLSDDLASLQYRTGGKQAAPLIIRTRGHQLQGIWHAGSPMQMILGSLRGIYLCVPRNMTQAAGFYNTLLEANDPAIVIEPLKGYGLKEFESLNFGGFKNPLGIPEIMVEGNDLTIVTYGWNVNHAVKAATLLETMGISAEVIDVQTLMPFDLPHTILTSVKKTGKVLFVDEDVPGGATAYMMQKVLEEQGAFDYLDTAPRTLSAKEHRPAYGIDGEYFSKPHVEEIFEAAYNMMTEVDIKKFQRLY